MLRSKHEQDSLGRIIGLLQVYWQWQLFESSEALLVFLCSLSLHPNEGMYSVVKNTGEEVGSIVWGLEFCLENIF